MSRTKVRHLYARSHIMRTFLQRWISRLFPCWPLPESAVAAEMVIVAWATGMVVMLFVLAVT